VGRTSIEKKDLNFSLKLSPEDRSYLDALAQQLNVGSAGDAARKTISSQRTLYELPPFMAERIRKDMKDRKMNIFTYMSELLGHRFYELDQPDKKGKK
jgi:hypothetical protein